MCAWSAARSAIRTRTFDDGGVLQIDAQNLRAPGHVQTPCLVPEMALELAVHRDHGERGERAAAGVLAVDRVDQPDPATG
jgi:hypothetical protein